MVSVLDSVVAPRGLGPSYYSSPAIQATGAHTHAVPVLHFLLLLLSWCVSTNPPRPAPLFIDPGGFLLDLPKDRFPDLFCQKFATFMSINSPPLSVPQPPKILIPKLLRALPKCLHPCSQVFTEMFAPLLPVFLCSFWAPLVSHHPLPKKNQRQKQHTTYRCIAVEKIFILVYRPVMGL